MLSSHFSSGFEVRIREKVFCAIAKSGQPFILLRNKYTMNHGYDDDVGDGNASDYDHAVSSSDEGDTGATTTGKLPRFQYPTFHNNADESDSDSNNDDEFQPRRRQGMSQEERLYGVFYEEGMSEDDQPKRKKSRKPFFKKASVGKTKPAVAPMFVKGAVMEPEKEIENETNQSDKINNEEAKEMESTKIAAPSEEELERKRRANEANQHFLNLLKKSSQDGRRKRPRSDFSSGETDDSPRDAQVSSTTTSQGLGFVASSSSSSSVSNSFVATSAGLGFGSDANRNIAESSSSTGIGFQSAGLGFQRSSDASEGINSSALGGAGLGFQNFGTQPQAPKRATLDPNLGKWEKHTKGIGAKLLSKMGYTGSGGLGSKKRRSDDTKPITSKPIEVKVRPASLGLGYGGFKEATHLNKKKEEMEKNKEQKRAQKASTAGAGSWNSSLPSMQDLLKDESWRETKEAKAEEKLLQLQRKQDAKGSSKPKIVSYQELLEKQKNAASGMKIIDMTGPSPKTDELTEDDQSSNKQPLAEELLHNIGLLMGTHESKLYSAHQAELASKQKLESMKEDAENLERRSHELKQRHAKLSGAISILDELEVLSASEDLTMSGVRPLLTRLTQNFSAEERLSLKFSQLILPALLQPFLDRRLLKEWSPLDFSIEDSKRWIKSTFNSVLPAVQNERSVERERFVTSLWNKFVLPRVQEVMKEANWASAPDLVPKSVALYDLLSIVGQEIEGCIKEKQIAPRMQADDGFVLPVHEESHEPSSKLRDDVEKSLLLNTVQPKLLRILSRWKPVLKEGKLSNPLHGIILPWLVHLDKHGTLQPILQECRSKVRSAVSFVQKEVKTEVEYLDTAMQIIRPWRGVLKTKYIDELVSAYITPPLARSLGKADSFADTHSSEELIKLVFLLHEEDLLSDTEFLSIIEGDFLNPWCATLYDYMQDANAATPLVHLAKNYKKWKQLLLPTSLSGTRNNGDFMKGRKVLQQDPIICRCFFAALLVINGGLGKGEEIHRPQATNYRVVLSRRSAEERKRINEDLSRMNTSGLAPSDQVRSDANREARARLAALNSHAPTFRDVVEEFARERDMLFQPRIGSSKATLVDGKQVFLFGTIPVYLDSNVVFALSPSKKWEPISLEELGTRAASH